MPQTQALQEGFAKTRHVLWLIGTLLLIAVLVVGWFGDHRSCERSKPVRHALIETREINRNAIPFWNARGELEIAARLEKRVQADEGIHELDCDRLLPGT